MLAGTPDDARPGHDAVSASGAGWRLAIGLVVWAVVAAASLLTSRAPAPLGTDAPAYEASGGRALEVLRGLARAPGERYSPPRPVGTAANARCRDRILAECRRVGLFPEVDVRFAVHGRENVAGTTHNIVARQRGSAAHTGPGRAILCMAHYDSVGAGPGIGDDLAGVAALLEVARALEVSGGLQRDVIFLFEDAEEHGLLGAEAFAAQHPWAEDVGVVINLEGRGTTGPSRMFETGAGNAWAVDAWASVATSPSATSVSVEVYRRMANDTDYTVWRERGVPGLNFAFIGDVARYHTPLDDFEHLAPSSLQHHASNALSAVRAMDRAVFPVEAGGDVTTRGPDAVFFDLGGRTLVTMRVKTLRMLAALTWLLALVGVGRGVASGKLRGTRVVLGVGAVFVAALVATFVVRLDGWLMALLGAQAVPHPAHPVPIVLSLIAMTIGGLALACGGLARALRASEAGAAILLMHALGGLLLAWAVPGAAFLFVFPVLSLALAASLMRMRGNVDARWGRAAIFALGVSALLWTPMHAGVVAAFGVASPVVIAVPLVIVGSFAMPLMMRAWVTSTPWVAAVGLSVGLLAAVFASTRPTHSADHPGRLNLVHIQDGDEEPRWQVMGMGSRPDDEMMTALAAALGLPGDAASPGPVSPGPVSSGPVSSGPVSPSWEPPMTPIPWGLAPLLAGSAQRLDVEMPTFEILEQSISSDGVTLVQGLVRSPRGGDQIVLEVHGARAMRVAVEDVDPFGFAFLAPAPEGQAFTLEVLQRRNVTLGVFDKRFGLEGLLSSRARSFFDARSSGFVPSHDGDGSLLISRYVLRCDGAGHVTVAEAGSDLDAGPDAESPTESAAEEETE